MKALLFCIKHKGKGRWILSLV